MFKKINHNKNKKIKVAITHGDFNGISYEVIIKTLSDSRLLEMFTPVVYGLPKVMGFFRKSLNIKEFNYHAISRPEKAVDQKVNIINVGDDSDFKIELGNSSREAGKMAFKALEKSIHDLKDKKVDVLVTAPINKFNIHSESFPFHGHTEYLTEKFNASQSLMLMVSGDLRVATVTNHIPVSEISRQLTPDLIMEKLNILHQSLRKDFLIDMPKIAVLGLNPHAGDNGLIGTEEKDFIEDVITRANEQKMLVFGPYPADGLFGSGNYKNFDAVLGMYHDQALTPFKILAGETGVNYTAGLPVVRTSPDHGTAYDIAGKFIASTGSFRNAIYLALDIYKNRKKWDEMNKNPLSVSTDSNQNRNRYNQSDD